MRERVFFDREIGIGERVHPLNWQDLEVLVNDNLTKCFKLRGITGVLNLYLTYRYIHGPLEDLFKPHVTPFSPEPLANEDVGDFPILINMCFNETARRTPSFQLHFPLAVKPNFNFYVSDWDITSSADDATQHSFEEGNSIDSVSLVLPNDKEKLLEMELVVVDRFWQYPETIFGPKPDL